MYDIDFYEDEHGNSEVKAFINDLREKSETSKDAKINFNKVIAYIDMLEEMGTRVGEPVTKHLDGEIWELRPLSNRILYAYYDNDTFVLLHHFLKKTQKTPKREIDKAKREIEDYKRRKGKKMSTWKEFRKELNITEEEEKVIEMEKELIRSMVAIREEQGMSQAELAQKCNIKQPTIARMEKDTHSPQIDSLLRVLAPLGYTLQIVPMKKA